MVRIPDDEQRTIEAKLRNGESDRSIAAEVGRHVATIAKVRRAMKPFTVEQVYERTIDDLLLHLDSIRERLISVKAESKKFIEASDALNARNMTLTEAILLDKHSDILKEIERIRKLGGAKARIKADFVRKVVQLEVVADPTKQKTDKPEEKERVA